MYRVNKNNGVSIALNVFKTLERLKVVDNISDPAEWTKWFIYVKKFVRNHEQY